MPGWTGVAWAVGCGFLLVLLAVVVALGALPARWALGRPMREELRQLWTRTNVSAEQLVADLQAWCRKAEESGIAALQEFSIKLRAAHA